MRKELTDKEISAINNLSFSKQLEIMRECADNCAVVSVPEYAKIMGISKRKVYQDIKDNKIIFIEIGDIKFPCVNANLK